MEDGIPLVVTKKPTIGDLVRTGSCIGNPQTNAVACLQNDQLAMFTEIVNEEAENSNLKDGDKFPADHWINKPVLAIDDFTLLGWAVRMDKAKFVSVMLRAGVDPNIPNPVCGFSYPIHVAVKNKSMQALKMLLYYEQNCANINATEKSSGRTALHMSVDSKSLEAATFLANNPGVNLDVQDKKGRQTPLSMAVKSGQADIASVLLQRGARTDLQVFGRVISDLIDEKMPQLNGIKTLGAHVASADPFVEIGDIIDKCSLLRGDDPEVPKLLGNFRSLIGRVSAGDLEQREHFGSTLLIKACNGDLDEFVKALLDGNVSPNYKPTSILNPPILVAARKGNAMILKMLFRKGGDITACSGVKNETVLHCILAQNDADKKKGLEECLEFLLKSNDDKMIQSIKKIVNRKDNLRNTALHHASRLWPEWVVRSLLEHGANIGMKNHFEELPIDFIVPEMLEKFFSEYCIKYDEATDVNHEKFEITFDYSFLAPPIEEVPPEARYRSSKVFSEETEKGLVNKEVDDSAVDYDEDSKYPLPETESLWYLSQAPQHQHLLKHPVITSFLWLKWLRIRRFFNRNLRFYLLFVFVLTWFIFETYGGESLKGTGQHTIYGFFVIFSMSMIVLILRDCILDLYDKQRVDRVKADQNRNGERDVCEDNEEYGRGLSCLNVLGMVASNWMEFGLVTFLVALLVKGSSLLWSALIILVGLLSLREAMQMAVSLRRYLLEVKSWNLLATIAMTLAILFHDSDEHETPNEDPLRRHLAAITIVLSWSELITLVGKHPKLTRYNIYVVMFYKVMATFFFFLLWYAFFIIAFGLAFYIMLHKDTLSNAKNGTAEAESDGDENKFFNSPWLSLVKTSTMFVGELEFSDIPVDLDSNLSPVSYLFFLSFVFLIVVVLMNLLNGLAVSDTSIIQAKAEVVSYTSQVETISYSESLLLGDPFNFLSNWPVLKWLRNVPPCSIWTPLYRNRKVRFIFNKFFGAEDILLFYKLLPDKTLTLLPNSKGKGCSDNFKVELMEESILLSAKDIVTNIIVAKESAHDQLALGSHIKSLEEKIALQDEKLESISQKLDLLVQRLK